MNRGDSFKKQHTTEGARNSRLAHQVELRRRGTLERMNKMRNIGGSDAPESQSSTDSLPMSTIPDRSAIPALLSKLASQVPEEVLQATKDFRRLLSQTNPPIQEVVDVGAVHTFVQFLHRSDMPQLQFEAAWALTNVASGTQENTKSVVDAHAVPVLVQLMTSPHDNVREQAVWALGNIAGDSAYCRDEVLKCNAVMPLLEVIKASADNTSILRNATWTLTNFCRGKPAPDFSWLVHAVPVLGTLLTYSDEEVLADVCWALSYLSDGSEERIQAILENVNIQVIVNMMNHSNEQLLTPALRTVGNIVTGTDTQTDVVLHAGALSSLKTLLSHERRSIRKETCWSLSNITAGQSHQIQAVFESGAFDAVLKCMMNDDFEVRKEAAWCVSNATCSATPAQIGHMVGLGCLQPIISMLNSNDTKIVKVLLDGLQNVFKAGATMVDAQGNNPSVVAFSHAGGIDILENLQMSASQKVYNAASKLIEDFIGTEDEVAEGEGPAMDEGGFNFQPQQFGQFNFGDQQNM